MGSRLTIRPTATKPYTASLHAHQMSAVATEADIALAISEVTDVTPQTVADSTAIDVAGIVADHNILLAALRTAGVLA